MDNPLTQPCIEPLEVCSLNNQRSIKPSTTSTFLGPFYLHPSSAPSTDGPWRAPSPTGAYSWTSGFWGQLRGSSAAIVAHPSSRPSCGLSPTCRLQVGWRSWIIWATSNTLCNSFSPQAVSAASSTLGLMVTRCSGMPLWLIVWVQLGTHQCNHPDFELSIFKMFDGFSRFMLSVLKLDLSFSRTGPVTNILFLHLWLLVRLLSSIIPRYVHNQFKV